MVDSLLVQPLLPCRNRFDQPREEWPHAEAIVEPQRRLRSGGCREADADVRSGFFDRGEQLRRHVVGMNVNRHALLLKQRDAYLRSRKRSISDFSWPPSISIMVPLTMCISGEASMTTRLATSSTSAMRPIGIDEGAS